MQSRYRLRRRRLDRIGNGNNHCQSAIHGGIERRLPFPAKPVGFIREHRDIVTELHHEPVSSGLDPATVNHCRYAETRGGLKALRVGKRQATMFRRLDNRFGNRMFGTVLKRGDKAQHFIRIEAFRRGEMNQRRLAERQRAGLVDGDDVGVTQGLERIAAAEQDTHLGGTAGSDHDRCRRGKAHGARAGNDENRDGVDERKGKRRLRPKNEPDDKGGECCQHHRRHEPVGHLVHQSLNGQLVGLRLLNHADDLRNQRIGTHLGSAEGEGTVPVDRAADDFGACHLGHRHRFARDHRFIHIGGTIKHQTVNGHLLAGANHDHIAGHNILQRHVNRFTIAQHAGRLGLQANEPLYRLAGAALGARFQKTAEQDQRDDNRRRLIIDIGRASRQDLGHKGGDHRKSPGGGGAQHDKRIHVRRQPQKRWYALFEEA